MKKAIITLGICFMMLVSCSNDNEEKGNIIGLWQQTSRVFMITAVEDGEILESETITDKYLQSYKFDTNKTYTSWYGGISVNGTFTFSDGILYLYNENNYLSYKVHFESQAKMSLLFEMEERYSNEYQKQIKVTNIYNFEKQN